MSDLRIATRASALALAQSRWVASEISRRHPGLVVELVEIRTTGDAKLGESLTAIGGKGAFTKELEDALLDRRCDVAVHSLKDLPTALPPGLVLACTPQREDPADVMLLREPFADPWRELPRGAIVGSSSPRRRALLLARRPDLNVTEFRGNVDTRLRRLGEGKAEAIVLARAGLARLGILDRLPHGLAAHALDAKQWLPAAGQGCLGLEARAGKERAASLLAPLHHADTFAAIRAERAFLHELGAGCSAPVGALARVGPAGIEMSCVLLAKDGKREVRRGGKAAVTDAEKLGASLARECMASGADLTAE